MLDRFGLFGDYGAYDHVISGRFQGAVPLLYNGCYHFNNCPIIKENLKAFKCIDNYLIRVKRIYIVEIVWIDDTKSLCRLSRPIVEHILTQITN